jgi:hypothetical protein
MAKGLRAKVDVSFPKVIAQTGDNDFATEGANYPAGSLIAWETLPPHVQKSILSGEKDSLVEAVEDEQEFDEGYAVQQGGEPTVGVFVPEHEAEAHALRNAGHIVIPKQQALEAAAAGQDHARAYQQAVKEHGLDQRPAQAHMAKAESDEGRVPEHWLGGMETRTGLPHNRGPQQAQQEEDSGDDSELGPEEEPEPARARPPAASSDEEISGSDSGENQA